MQPVQPNAEVSFCSNISEKKIRFVADNVMFANRLRQLEISNIEFEEISEKS